MKLIVKYLTAKFRKYLKTTKLVLDNKRAFFGFFFHA